MSGSGSVKRVKRVKRVRKGNIIFSGAFLFLLAACGGGGGGSSADHSAATSPPAATTASSTTTATTPPGSSDTTTGSDTTTDSDGDSASGSMSGADHEAATPEEAIPAGNGAEDSGNNGADAGSGDGSEADPEETAPEEDHSDLPVVGGTQTVKLLMLRGDFGDNPMPLTDDEWRQMLQRRVSELQEYMDRTAFGRADIQFHISEIHRFATAAEVFNPDVIAAALRQRYQDNVGISTLDIAEHAEDVTAIVYSFPSVGLIGDAGAIGGFRQMWMPGRDILREGFIHEYGHTFDIGHMHAMEGVPFGAAPVDYEIFTEVIKGSADGLHMLGSEGDGRIGDHTAWPLPVLSLTEFLPDDYVGEITENGRYRIYDSQLVRLPASSEDKIGYRIQVRGRPFWIAFTPAHVESWSNFGSEGFDRGLIIHWNYRNDLFALHDFTPNSYRSTKPLTAERHPEDLFRDTRDGALQIGNVYTLPDSEVTIRPVERGTEPDGRRYIDFTVEGVGSDKDGRVTATELNFLLLRGEYDGTEERALDSVNIPSTNDLRVRQAHWTQLALEHYFGRYGYGRVKVNLDVMSVPVQLGREAGITSRRQLALALQQGYRDLASMSDVDDIEALTEADHISYITPVRTLPISENIRNSTVGGVPATFTAASNPNVQVMLQDFTAGLDLQEVAALEGAPAGVSPDDYQIFTEDLRHTRDGLFVVASGGTPSELETQAPLPGFHLNALGILPDEFIGNLTGEEGVFRLYDGVLHSLPDGDEKVFYTIEIAGRKFWLSYFPFLAELYGDSDDYDASGFARGIVMQYETTDAGAPIIATLDFTPGSVRTGIARARDREDLLFLDTRDGALQIGEAFTFPDSSLVIEPISIGSDELGRYIDIRLSVTP